MGKLLAYLERSAARDAWDLACLPVQAREAMASEQFRSWFIALSATLDHPLTTYTREIIERRVTDRTVAEQLSPVLIGQTARLQTSDLIERSWAVMSPFMTLSDNEAKYLASIQHGELHPELLFAERPEEGQRMASHPAIQWKLVNVRRHLGREDAGAKARSPERDHT